MPPSFAPTHAWVCPIWHWHHARVSTPGATIFGGGYVTHYAATTVVYVVNSRSTPVSVHVDCYTSDGALETAVRVAADVAPRTRFEASLLPTRAPMLDARGDYRESGEGWFHLWSNGPVTPAAVLKTIHHPTHAWEIPRPVKPVEIEAALAEVAPPLATAQPAPEGTGAASGESFEANLSLDEAVAWFESVRSGRPFERQDGTRSS